MKSRKKLITMILSIVSAVVVIASTVAGTYAIFSESKQDDIQGEAGSVTIKPIYVATTTEGKLMPGDVVDFFWTVENAGNASILTRNTVYLYWEYDNESFADNSNGNNSIFVYKQNTSNSLIKADMLSKSPSSPNLINLGELSTFVINGEKRTGYKFTVYGDDLDGVGEDAQTGISREVDYDSELDDSYSTRDVVSYKIGLSQYANINTSGQTLKIYVVTEAMQYENTDDSDWSLVGSGTYTIR